MESVTEMSISGRTTSWAVFFRRVVAAGCAALVLSLAILAACPDLHHFLHGEKDACGDGDDGCAVVLFAHGLTETAAAILVVVALRLLAERVSIPVGFLVLAPRFQLPPGCGPPRSSA